MHDTKISRSRANVDDHRVQQGFQSISHGKRLGHQHHAIGDSIHGAPQALFAYPKGFGGHADDGAYLLTAFAFLFHPAEGHQVSQYLLNRPFVLFGSFFDKPALKRAAKVQHGAAIQSLTTDEDRLLY